MNNEDRLISARAANLIRKGIAKSEGGPFIEEDHKSSQNIRTHLYRHYDGDGRLLYVGISLSALNRLAQHRDHSVWFSSIRSVKIEEFPDRNSALEAETIAIQTETPLCNIRKVSKKSLPEPPLTEAEKSSEYIVERVAGFDVCYTPKEASETLKIPLYLIHQHAISGTLRRVVISEKIAKDNQGRDRVLTKYVVTGWQLIEFVEWLQAGGKLIP